MASPNAQATPQNGPQAPKAQGYNKLARLMGPNSEMAIFRRFGSLNMMNLLYLQAELMELERKYEVAYCEDAQSSVESVSNFCRDFTKLRASKGTGYSDQLDQLLNISEKLEKYSTITTALDDMFSETFRRADVSSRHCALPSRRRQQAQSTKPRGLCGLQGMACYERTRR